MGQVKVRSTVSLDPLTRDSNCGRVAPLHGLQVGAYRPTAHRKVRSTVPFGLPASGQHAYCAANSRGAWKAAAIRSGAANQGGSPGRVPGRARGPPPNPSLRTAGGQRTRKPRPLGAPRARRLAPRAGYSTLNVARYASNCSQQSSLARPNASSNAGCHGSGSWLRGGRPRRRRGGCPRGLRLVLASRWR